MSRKKRVADFCRQSGGLYDVALRPENDCRPCDSGAITHWRLTEVTRRPICFGPCQRTFSDTVRPAAFLTATANRNAGVAVCAMCSRCWSLPADQVEAAALSVLRRHLNKNGRWL